MPNGKYKLARRFEPLGVYGDSTKEVTLGYWDMGSGSELRMDIRKWENGDLGKGISLTEDEVRRLRDILDQVHFGK